MTYTLLDLFCCAGGASMGYARAGFEVVGVDIAPQPHYPFEFYQGDALRFLREHGHEFDVIAASPPCQHASAGTRAFRVTGREYPRLIEPTRETLLPPGKPYVIENVQGASLHNPVTLCGTMFGLTTLDDDGTALEMWRHRLFESNVPLESPMGCRHGKYAPQVAGSYGGARRDKYTARHVRHGGYVPSPAVQQRLLGIDWVRGKSLHQAIPPAYTEWIGRRLIEHLGATT